jgi:hypothetical protein
MRSTCVSLALALGVLPFAAGCSGYRIAVPETAPINLGAPPPGGMAPLPPAAPPPGAAMAPPPAAPPVPVPPPAPAPPAAPPPAPAVAPPR